VTTASPAAVNIVSRSKRSPLYLRIYSQKLMTEIVRAIGYEMLPGGEARSRLQLLCDEYGREQVSEAAGELIAAQPGTVDTWGLTDEVRRFARALLGPPPAETRESTVATKPTTEVSVADQSSKAKPSASEHLPVKASRKIVVARFRECLNGAGVELPEDVRKVLGDRGRMTPDFLLGGGPPYELVTVRRILSASQRHDMQQWLEVSEIGDQASRIWAREVSGQWQFTSEVIATKRDCEEENDPESPPNLGDRSLFLADLPFLLRS
jgi:hypothetical protein